VAVPVYLFLKVNGVAVEGESSQTGFGREHSIECLYYQQGVATSRQASSGVATGRRTFEPLVIRKWIDKSSPLLAKALAENRVVDGVFRFFRQNPSGDGTTQHYFTTEITMGRIAAITQFVTDVEEPGELPDQPFEEVQLVFNGISWTHEIGGVTYQDSWSAGAGGKYPVGGSSGAAGASPAAAGGAAAGASGAAGASAGAAGRALDTAGASASAGGGAAAGSSGAAGASAGAAGGVGGAAGSSQSGRAEVSSAVPVAAPERLRPVVVERRPPSRVATIVPLTDTDGAG
jgi:type VI secretion system secreted protein Hcp